MSHCYTALGATAFADQNKNGCLPMAHDPCLYESEVLTRIIKLRKPSDRCGVKLEIYNMQSTEYTSGRPLRCDLRQPLLKSHYHCITRTHTFCTLVYFYNSLRYNINLWTVEDLILLVPTLHTGSRHNRPKQKTFEFSCSRVSTSHNFDPDCIVNEKAWRKANKFTTPWIAHTNGQWVATIDVNC